MDRNKTNQILLLKDIIRRALSIYELESGSYYAEQLPLNDTITLDSTDERGNLEVYAVTTDSAILWRDDSAFSFEDMDVDDIYTLQDIIKDEYQID